MKTNLDATLNEICFNLENEFGSGLKYYGEAIRSLSTNSAANYITINYSDPCSVDDQFDQTIFLIRESGAVTTQMGGGMNRSLSRTIDFRLVVNSKSLKDEYRIINRLNQIGKVVYSSTQFDQEAVARTFFGLNERNTDSAFFTISFSILETIYCKVCN
jgi:hypothetical protein